MMAIPPERRDLLRMLPPDLIEALRQPLPHEQRRAMITSLIADQHDRQKA
jgi:hypothetical protein